MERAHQTLKIPIQKLQEGEFKYSSPHQILLHAFFVINNRNAKSSRTIAMLRHWCPEQQNTKPLIKWKDLLSRQWRGPDPMLTSSQGCACTFSTGCRFSYLDPGKADSSCHSPPGTWFLHCLNDKK